MERMKVIGQELEEGLAADIGNSTNSQSLNRKKQRDQRGNTASYQQARHSHHGTSSHAKDSSVNASYSQPTAAKTHQNQSSQHITVREEYKMANSSKTSSSSMQHVINNVDLTSGDNSGRTTRSSDRRSNSIENDAAAERQKQKAALNSMQELINNSGPGTRSTAHATSTTTKRLSSENGGNVNINSSSSSVKNVQNMVITSSSSHAARGERSKSKQNANHETFRISTDEVL